MSSKARIIGVRLGVIAIGLLLTSAFIGGAAAADLKIGFTLSLTGGTDDYGKAARPGRKVGHVTVTATDETTLDARLASVEAIIGSRSS